MRVACVQLNSGADKAVNVAAAVELVRRAAAAGARLIVLPETWTFKGSHAALPAMAEAIAGPSNTVLAGLAAELGVYVLAGSIYERGASPARYRQRQRAVRSGRRPAGRLPQDPSLRRRRRRPGVP